VRIDFGDGKGQRKLKPKHKNVSDAVRDSGRSIGELINDPFNGYRYLLRALLAPTYGALSLDKCSELIDSYIEANREESVATKKPALNGLTEALVESLSDWLTIEQPAKDIDEDEHPNAPSPDLPGRDGA
jgi:hypothetical protein